MYKTIIGYRMGLPVPAMAYLWSFENRIWCGCSAQCSARRACVQNISSKTIKLKNMKIHHIITRSVCICLINEKMAGHIAYMNIHN